MEVSNGQFIFSKGNEDDCLKRLYDYDQLVFRYCDETGVYAEGRFPANPNGDFHDIAGICNPEGNVFGLMPHPERAYYGWQLPDWTRESKMRKYGDGRLVFESTVEHLLKER
jgi:phosphoribosylformylglycinamidine (FGAM) synthase-like amidotransferase family enzyme